MTARHATPAPPVAPPQRRTWQSAWAALLPRRTRDLRWLTLLALVLAGGIYLWPDYVPIVSLVLPLLGANLLLGPRHLPWFVVFMLVLVVVAVTRQDNLSPRTVIGIVVIFIVGFIILMTSFRRTRLGVGGSQGESMLVDLRDRIQGQGGIPVLPDGWYAESALRSAGGTPFAGDFVVASRPQAGDRLDVAVVDVSGKGEGAGTRALLLSGALGGLLGALPSADFLVSANDYLLQQNWEEGFATAIHLSLDLRTGEFERAERRPPRGRAAGQPAPDGGRCTRVGARPSACCRGASSPPSAAPAAAVTRSCSTPTAWSRRRSRDIGLGIDRMLGQAEQLLRGEFDGRRPATRREPAARATTTARWCWCTAADRHASVAGDGEPCGTMTPADFACQKAVRVACGCSSMVEPQSSKLMTRVRFPSSAPSGSRTVRGVGTWRGVA